MSETPTTTTDEDEADASADEDHEPEDTAGEDDDKPEDTAGEGADEPAASVVAAASRRRGLRVLRAPWLLPAAVVGFVVVLPLWGLLRTPGPPMEEGFMLVFPERVLEGDVPNDDFLHLYGPGSLWFIAALYRVLGIELWVERLAGLVQLVGVVSGVTLVAYRWGRWTAIVAGATAAVLIMPPTGLTALAWIGGLALAVWTVAVAVRAVDPDRDEASRRRTLIGGGVLAGAALLFRPDLVVALGLPLGALWLWGLDRTGRRQLLGGALLGVSPYLVHFAMAGPGNAIGGMVLEPVFDLRAGRTLPFPPDWNEITSHLSRVLIFRDWPWLPVPHLGDSQQLFVWSWILIAAAFAIVLIGLHARRADSPDGWRLLTLGLLCVGVLPQAIQRPDIAHLAWVSAVPFGVMAPALVEWSRLRHAHRVARGKPDRARRHAWGRAALPLAPLAVMLVVIPHYTVRWYADYVGQTFDYRREGIVSIENRGRSFTYGRVDVGAAADELLADIERLTEPGQSLVVGTGDLRIMPYSESYLYFLLPQLDPGTRYIEMDPGVANADDSGLADELRAADVVILSTVYDNWDEPNTSMDPGSNEPNQVLDDEYCLEGSYGENEHYDDQGGRGWYELYLKC